MATICCLHGTARAEINCAVPPTCEELGYTMTAEACSGRAKLKCPFDDQYFCDVSSCYNGGYLETKPDALSTCSAVNYSGLSCYKCIPECYENVETVISTGIYTDVSDITVLPTDGKFIIFFYETWCGPCKMLLPRLQTISSTCNIPLVVIRPSEDPIGSADYCDVTAVPTTLIYDGKTLLDAISGANKAKIIEYFPDCGVE